MQPGFTGADGRRLRRDFWCSRRLSRPVSTSARQHALHLHNHLQDYSGPCVAGADLVVCVQLITALPSLSQVNPDVSGGVAVWAHVGGFITGMLLIKVFEKPDRVAEREAAARRPEVWSFPR